MNPWWTRRFGTFWDIMFSPIGILAIALALILLAMALTGSAL